MPLHSIFDFSVSCASEERRGGAFLPCRVELARRSRIREKITIRPDGRRSGRMDFTHYQREATPNIISTSRIMWNRRSSSAGFFVSSLRFSDELLPFRSRLCFLRLRQSCSEACHIYCHKYPLASVSHGGGQASFESSRTTYSTPGQRPR